MFINAITHTLNTKDMLVEWLDQKMMIWVDTNMGGTGRLPSNIITVINRLKNKRTLNEWILK